jgi:hypothetical protein
MPGEVGPSEAQSRSDASLSNYGRLWVSLGGVGLGGVPSVLVVALARLRWSPMSLVAVVVTSSVLGALSTAFLYTAMRRADRKTVVQTELLLIYRELATESARRETLESLSHPLRGGGDLTIKRMADGSTEMRRRCAPEEPRQASRPPLSPRTDSAPEQKNVRSLRDPEAGA